MLDSRIQSSYKKILEEELQEATGCTEPIALALAGAKAAQVLGGLPEKADVYCSGNIIKNVKAVVVPNSGGIRGIDTAVVLGMSAGDPDVGLQVISKVSDEQRNALKKHLQDIKILPWMFLLSISGSKHTRMKTRLLSKSSRRIPVSL